MSRITKEIPPPADDEVAGADMTHMIVPITSDRGLCGGVNSTVIKAAKALCNVRTHARTKSTAAVHYHSHNSVAAQ